MCILASGYEAFRSRQGLCVLIEALCYIQREACKADSARLQAKVEAVLRHTHSPVQLSAAQRPVCSTDEEAHGTTAAAVRPPEASKWRKRAHGQASVVAVICPLKLTSIKCCGFEAVNSIQDSTQPLTNC